MIIDILCPTRGRPHLFKQLYESLQKTTRDPSNVRLWVYLSKDDKKLEQYTTMKLEGDIAINAQVGSDAPTCWMWNTLADTAMQNDGDLFFLMGDDVIFQTEGWDEIYRDNAKRYYDGIFVLAPSDGRGDGIPHPCVSRSWIDVLGFFVNPVFYHWGVDSYTEALAKSLDRIVKLPDVKITHAKVGEACEADDTYKRIRSGVWHQRDTKLLDFMKHNYGYVDREKLNYEIERYKRLIA